MDLQRLCLSCREKFPRENLIRILKENKTGKMIVNPSKFQHGRSIYICKTEICLDKLKNNKKYKQGLQEIIKEIDLKK